MVGVRRFLVSYVTVAGRVDARMVRNHMPTIIAVSIYIGGDNRRELKSTSWYGDEFVDDTDRDIGFFPGCF